MNFQIEGVRDSFDTTDAGELRGIAFTLASVVRLGYHDLARQIADSLELQFSELVGRVEQSDLKELQQVLVR